MQTAKKASRVFVTNEVLFIQGEERVDQELRNASHTASGVINIGRLFESAGEPQAELGTPQAFLDNPVFQSRRVLGHRLFQTSDFAVRVMKRDTHKRLAEVHNTSEAVRGLLIVVVAPYPLSPFLDNPSNLVQIPIEKVHFAHRSLDPCSSVHPRSPPIHFRDGWDCSRRADASSHRPHMLDGEWCRFAVIHSNVNVGIGPRETASV
jgi:hypothetical protein